MRPLVVFHNIRMYFRRYFLSTLYREQLKTAAVYIASKQQSNLAVMCLSSEAVTYALQSFYTKYGGTQGSETSSLPFSGGIFRK